MTWMPISPVYSPPEKKMTTNFDASCASLAAPPSCHGEFDVLDHVTHDVGAWLWTPCRRLSQRMMLRTYREVTKSL